MAQNEQMQQLGLLSAPKANVSKTGQEINQWFSPNIANWTTSYNPGQTYDGSNLELQLFRPEVQKYLASMGLDPNLMWDQQAYDPQGNPVTPKAFDPTKSILDNPDAYASLIQSQSGSKGSKYLDDFLAKNDLGVRFGNTGNTYINQLYNKTSGDVLASDVNEDKMNFMQKNGWMIPLAALGGIAAMGPTALGEGAVGLGSTGASITGGGISAAGGVGADVGLGLAGADIGSLPQTALNPSPSFPTLTTPSAQPSFWEVANGLPGGEAGLSPFGNTSGALQYQAPSAGDVLNGSGNWWSDASVTLNGAGQAGSASGGLIDQIKNSTIGKGIGQVADMVGGGTNLAGLVGAVAGGLGGGSGDNTATSQNKMDPRMDAYVYGTGPNDPNSYLGQLLAKYKANPSGINATMQQGLDASKAALNDPNYAQSYTQMRNFGTGLLSQPMAGNPFTQGQAQMPQPNMQAGGGLLGNLQDRAKIMIGQGRGLIG